MFPFKSQYDAVNIDIFNPFLMEPDPEVGEEDDEDAIRAHAPQDLDASDDRVHLPAPGGEAGDALHREDGPPYGGRSPGTRFG